MNHLQRAIWVLALTAWCCGPIRAADVVEPAKLDALARPLAEQGWVAGLSVGLVTQSGVQFAGYGHTADASSPVPNEKTEFEIGSVTKVFTGLLLADMVERGLVKLDTPIQDLLGDSIKAPQGEREITLVDIATHSSGLPRMPTNFNPKDPGNPYADYSVEQMKKFLEGYKLARQPGAKSEYSNLAMGLLGHALALKEDTTYEALVRERICKPLAMDDTRITLDENQRTRLAAGHDADGNPQANWDLPTLAGAGALRSTASDMVRFVRAYLGMEHSPLDAAMAKSREVYFKVPDGGNDLGLCWHIRRSGGIVWHNGQTGGYHSFVAFVPEKQVGVVVLCNSAAQHVDQLGFALVELLSGGDPKPPSLPKPVEVPTADLERLTGKYRLGLLAVVTITREKDRLYLQITGQPKIAIYPEADDRFYLRAAEASVTFESKDGEVERLVIHQNGLDLPAPKQKPVDEAKQKTPARD
ncbi:MAG TPA: serine hydrolase [Pirellulales bacterium]|jgi:CubicO group peptidase (beta-lactamase class C family)